MAAPTIQTVKVEEVAVGDVLHGEWHGEWTVTEVRVLTVSVAITARRFNWTKGSSAQWLLEKWQTVEVAR